MVRFVVILCCSFICAFSAPSTSVPTILSLISEAKTAHLSTCKMSLIILTSESFVGQPLTSENNRGKAYNRSLVISLYLQCIRYSCASNVYLLIADACLQPLTTVTFSVVILPHSLWFVA